MCRNEYYSRVWVGSKHLSDTCPIKSALKEGDALRPLVFNLALEYAIRKVQTKTVGSMVHSSFWFMLMMMI